MLVKVTINNFLSIKEEQTIKLNKDVTSVIGKNESGKSTILKAIYKLNGAPITKEEKNVSLKSEETSIKGYFKISKEELKKINDDYRSNCEYSFYLLPDEYGELYFSKEVDETKSTYYELYYMGEDNVLKKINTSMFSDRIRKQIDLIFKDESETDEIKNFLKDIKKLNDYEIKEKIRLLNTDGDLKEKLDSIGSEIEKNYWINLLPKYKFIKFSSFSDILKDNVLFSEIKNSQQAQNILRIANIDLEELGDAFENDDEQKLEDLQTQYIDIVSKKFKEIFQQADENFKLKIRFGTSKKEIIFLTQDKTSGNSSINLSQRSDGFKWYLSLYLTLYEYLNKTDNTKYILLLDEPNLYLHPGAQNNLLFNVFYKEFNDVQIVFTTHSPYMIDSDNSFSIRIIEKENQTKIYNSSREYAEKSKKLKDVDTLSPLLTALELNISNSLIINDKNILITVEGIQDVYLLQAMIKKCKYVSKFENIKFVSGMSAEKVPYMFSYLYGMGYNVFALLDNDKTGRKAIETITNSDETADEIMKRLLMYNLDNDFSEDFLLENLLSESDKTKYLPNKSTVLYKRIFDEIDQLEFDKITITNFKNFFDAILKKIK